VDGAQDAAGNAQVAYSEIDAFDVDTSNPTVVSVTIDDTQITDSDAAGILNITVEYSEPMDTGVYPTLTFAPDVEGSGTLTFSSSDWYDSTHYRVNYTIADVNEEQFDVDITADDAQDVAGNSVTYTETDAFDVDTENPTVTVIIILESTPAGIGEWVNITVTTDADASAVVGNLSDLSGLNASETFLGSGSNWYYNFTVVAGTWEGLGTINVTVTDDAGNTDYNDTEAAEVDEVIPAVTITSTSDLVSASYIVNATIAGANATDVWYKIDALTEVQLPNIGGENYGATIDTGALTEGAHTIQIIAYDAAGNVNDTESVGITVDHTLPEVNIISAEATVSVNYELTVKITDTNIDTQNLSYNIDDGTPVTLNLVLGDDYNATIDISGLSDDQHTIKIIAYDLAGNVNTTESIIITVDNTAPPVTQPNIPALTSSTSHTISGTTDPNAMVEVLIDDFVVATVTADTAGDYSVDISLSEGQNDIVIRITDEAGNVAETSPLTVERDTAPPTTPVFDDLPAKVTKSSLTITGDTEPGATVEILVDDVVAAEGTADANGDFSIKITLEKGENQIRARATDGAGNTAVSSLLTVKYEEEAPADYTLFMIIVPVIIVIIILVLLLTRKRGKGEEVEGDESEPEEEVISEESPEEEAVYEEEPGEEVIYEEEYEEAPGEEEIEEGEGLEYECPDCGYPVPGTVLKCPKCGAEFEDVEEVEGEEIEEEGEEEE
ncbi:MAG: Ig-like domain-containing protein, partial [Thermoplasmata archaeon]